MSPKVGQRALATAMIAFGLGFLAGAVWQARYGVSPSTSNPLANAPSNESAPETRDDLDEAEREIVEALENPEFRRVHDHLMRENSIRMEIPGIPSEPREQPVPASEREPVRFTLP